MSRCRSLRSFSSEYDNTSVEKASGSVVRSSFQKCRWVPIAVIFRRIIFVSAELIRSWSRSAIQTSTAFNSEAVNSCPDRQGATTEQSRFLALVALVIWCCSILGLNSWWSTWGWGPMVFDAITYVCSALHKVYDTLNSLNLSMCYLLQYGILLSRHTLPGERLPAQGKHTIYVVREEGRLIRRLLTRHPHVPIRHIIFGLPAVAKKQVWRPHSNSRSICVYSSPYVQFMLYISFQLCLKLRRLPLREGWNIMHPHLDHWITGSGSPTLCQSPQLTSTHHLTPGQKKKSGGGGGRHVMKFIFLYLHIM